MKRRNDVRRGKDIDKQYWMRLIVFSLMVNVLLLLIGIIILSAADKWHMNVESAIMWLMNADNYFNGDLWFSAAATLIGAMISGVPGLSCGILALKQTKRLHELEDRYHAPMMELESTELRFVRMDDLQSVHNKEKLNKRQYFSINKAKKLNCNWHIELKVVFHISNGITLKGLEIENVDFSLGGKDYKAAPVSEMGPWEERQHEIWDLERSNKAGRIVYTLTCSLCMFQQESVEAQAEFWNDFEEFVSYRERRNFEYMYMDVDVYTKLRYEYNGNKGAENMLKLTFDVSDNQKQDGVYTNQTANGFFTYDIY